MCIFPINEILVVKKAVSSKLIFSSYWLIILVILYLCGCNSPTITTQGMESDTSVATQPTNLRTIATLIDESPTATSTIQHATVTSTSEPTLTPIATVPIDILKYNLLDLFSTNGNCRFPCWWGIKPGDSIQEAHLIAPLVGKPLRSFEGYYYYTLSLDSVGLPDLDINFYNDDKEVIERITVILREPSRLSGYYEVFEKQISLSSLMDFYGQPDEILLLVKPRTEKDSPISYSLIVVYKTDGFAVEYYGVVDSEDPIQICSIKITDYHLYSITIYLQDSNRIDIEQRRMMAKGYKVLDEAATMGTVDFYQIFSSPNNGGCIKTSIDIWK